MGIKRVSGGRATAGTSFALRRSAEEVRRCGTHGVPALPVWAQLLINIL
ncbi:MAG: hypothetical protein K2J03_06215 [Muribaculaceae bacterium]|nr:hypothetical protein [Muribaculaceae bacterium]